MPKKRLTEEGVKKLRPLPGKQLLLFDTVMPGLLLNVSYAGTKTWRVLHYVNSKPVTVKLGRYPVLTLKEARDAASDFLKDPDGARRRANSDTFEGVALDFLERHVQKNGLRTANEIERKLRKYILPEWGSRRFLDIRRGDVSSLLDTIETDNGPAQADAVLALISKLCSWYTADLGGDDACSEGTKAILRRACILIVVLEQLESDFANKGSMSMSALAEYQRTSNTLRRLLTSVGLDRRAKDVTPPKLSDYIEGKASRMPRAVRR